MPKNISADSARTRDEAAAVWVSVDTLTPWADNPRINDKAAAKVAESIKRFGFGSPILARKADGEVIAGHTRLKAAKMLGLEKVPVRYLDLDPADAHLLALADNKLNEVAEWDDAALGRVLSEYGLDDAALAGFDSKELDALAAGFIAATEDVDAAFGKLPDGDREPFQQMTFTLHDEQADAVKRAIEHAKDAGPFDGPNQNSNGNALERICQAYLDG